jgi:hypothetical protein
LSKSALPDSILLLVAFFRRLDSVFSPRASPANPAEDHDCQRDPLWSASHYVVACHPGWRQCDEANCYANDRRNDYFRNSRVVNLCCDLRTLAEARIGWLIIQGAGMLLVRAPTVSWSPSPGTTVITSLCLSGIYATNGLLSPAPPSPL